MNTVIQHTVEDHMRGRVMAIYSISYLGLSPIGNFEIGVLAEKYGAQVAIRLNAFVLVLFALFLFSFRKKILTRK
jgi:hypothetical protein